jgi:hypothetical protein
LTVPCSVAPDEPTCVASPVAACGGVPATVVGTVAIGTVLVPSELVVVSVEVMPSCPSIWC